MIVCGISESELEFFAHVFLFLQCKDIFQQWVTPNFDKFSPTLKVFPNSQGKLRFVWGGGGGMLTDYLIYTCHALQCSKRTDVEYGSTDQLFRRDQSPSTPALVLKPFPCPEAASMSTAMWQLPGLPSTKAAESWAVLSSGAHRRFATEGTGSSCEWT